MKTFDVGAALDEGQWGGYQKLLVFATALTIVLDGLDNQLLGAAIPSLMKEWSLARAAFSTVLTLRPGRHGDRRRHRRLRRRSLRPPRRAARQRGDLRRPDDLHLFRRQHRHARRAAVLRRARPRRRDAECRRAVVRIRPEAAPAVRGDADDRVHPARRIARRLCRRTDPAGLRLARALSRRRHPAARAGRAPAEGPAGVSALSRPAARALARAAHAARPARPRRASGRDVPRRHREGRQPRRRCASSSSRSSGATRWRSARRSSSACSRSTSARTGFRRCWPLPPSASTSGPPATA